MRKFSKLGAFTFLLGWSSAQQKHQLGPDGQKQWQAEPYWRGQHAIQSTNRGKINSVNLQSDNKWNNINTQSDNKWDTVNAHVDITQNTVNTQSDNNWNTVISHSDNKWNTVIPHSDNKWNTAITHSDNKWKTVKAHVNNKWNKVNTQSHNKFNTVNTHSDNRWDTVGMYSDNNLNTLSDKKWNAEEELNSLNTDSFIEWNTDKTHNNKETQWHPDKSHNNAEEMFGLTNTDNHWLGPSQQWKHQARDNPLDKKYKKPKQYKAKIRGDATQMSRKLQRHSTDHGQLRNLPNRYPKNTGSSLQNAKLKRKSAKSTGSSLQNAKLRRKSGQNALEVSHRGPYQAQRRALKQMTKKNPVLTFGEVLRTRKFMSFQPYLPQATPRQDNSCPGRCSNVLVCALAGGEGKTHQQCIGVFGVCCTQPGRNGMRGETGERSPRILEESGTPVIVVSPPTASFSLPATKSAIIKPSYNINSALIKPSYNTNSALIKPSYNTNSALIKPIYSLPKTNAALAKPSYSIPKTSLIQQIRGTDEFSWPSQKPIKLVRTTRLPVVFQRGPSLTNFPSHQLAPTTRKPVFIPGSNDLSPFLQPVFRGVRHGPIPSSSSIGPLGPLPGPPLGPLPGPHQLNGNQSPVPSVLSNFVEDGRHPSPDSVYAKYRWKGCGESRNVAESRILGGLDAGYGQFPWTALVVIKGPGIDKMCAGTLVNDRYIITAGHCTQYCRPDSVTVPVCLDPVPISNIRFKVVLGEYDYKHRSIGQNIQRYHAVNVVVHPHYRNVHRYRDNGFLEAEPQFDIAILTLDRSVKPAENIGPICLPQSGHSPDPGSLATVVGWGRLGVYSGSPHSSVLQAVTVPVLTSEECQAENGGTPTEDQLCAGKSRSGHTACPGDSGGGLMERDEEGRWTLVGIVSTGPSECGLTPVIYHNVVHTLPWIRSIITTGV